jgi:isochorismate pyruvate lyase
MERAAPIKQHRIEVRDEARISDVVNNVLAAAKRYGLSEAIAEPVWRTIVECCIKHELAVFDDRTHERLASL